MSKAQEEKRMMDSLKLISKRKREQHEDTHETDKTWENESSRDLSPMVRISVKDCLLYTSPSPRDFEASRMPSSA